MSVVYNGVHSVTFIESSQSITAGQTLTSFTSVRNTWNSFHLVPANRPYISPMEPKIQLVTDTVSSKVFDITDAVAGGMTYSARKGSWDFLVDHDKWYNWYTAKQTIEDYLNGKRRYCFLNGDDTLLYCGRFKVSGWEDGTQYSKITIEYDLDFETYALSANLNRPTSLSVSWKSSAPTVYEHQKKDDIRNYLNATISYGGYYTGSCDIDVIEGSFSGTGSQSVTVSYTANDLSTFEPVILTASITITISADYLKSISVNVNKNVKFNYGDPKDKIRQNSTIVRHYASGISDSIAGTNANSLNGTIDGYGLYQVQMTYSGKTGIASISLPIEYTWNCLDYTIKNNTYKQFFKVGDEFPLTIENEYDGYTQIVAFDSDIDSNGNTIPVTFITKNLLNTYRSIDSSGSNVGAYPNSELKTYIDGLKLSLPVNLQNMIVAASKTSRGYNGGTPQDLTTNETLWIPSYREIFGETYYYEQTGVIYNTIYKDTASRIKAKVDGSSADWWLRSAESSNYFRWVYADGNASISSANSTHGVAIGFCLGNPV